MDEGATKIADLEQHIGGLIDELRTLRKATPAKPCPTTTDGETTLGGARREKLDDGGKRATLGESGRNAAT